MDPVNYRPGATPKTMFLISNFKAALPEDASLAATLGYYFNEFYLALFRKKSTAHEYSKLKKALNLLDVTLLSLGKTLGVGPYIFIGEFANSMGPAMTIAYLSAAVVAFLAAALYAELTCRAGGSGGAYSCTYVFIGELPATIVGWHLCLQYIIGSAVSVRGVSDLFEYSTNYVVSNYTKAHIMKFDSPLFGDYPDFISFCIAFIIITLMTFGLKEVSLINDITVSLNLFLLLLIILVSGSIGDWKHWTEPPKEGCGKGGFMPYGFRSIWKGSGLAFFAFIGFDAAVHAAGECHEPDRLIPLALILSNATLFILYMLQSTAHTLAWSYCDQDLERPVLNLFSKTGVTIMSWICLVGVPIALMGSILASKFPLSRILYAMAEDGLFFSYMAKLKLRTRVPVNALYTSSFLTGLCATLFTKKQLAELTCLATLLAYNMIAVIVIYLRYTDIRMEEPKSKGICAKIFNIQPRALVPTKTTSRIVGICCFLIILAAHPVVITLDYDTQELGPRELAICIIVGALFLFLFFIISCQPKSEEYLVYKVKLVPFTPMISVLLNSYLTLTYEYYTWIRLTIFLALGMIIYVTYGLWNSQLRKINDQFYSGNY